jgi:hypothetical protein
MQSQTTSRAPTLALLAALLAAAVGAPIACGTSSAFSSNSSGSGGGVGSGSTGSGANGGGGAAASGGAGGGLLTGTEDPIVSLAIQPADPVIEVLDGALPAPTLFKGVGTTKKGATVPVTGVWSFDRYDVGQIADATGAFTATGLLGGKGKVTLKAGALVASTSATVRLHYTYDPGAIDPAVKAKLAGASNADPALALVYPYDKTVFPRGLAGPTLQWNGGGPDDVYYLRVTSSTFELDAWSKVPPPSRADFPTTPVDLWKKLTDSTSGDVTVSVQRYDGTTAYLPKTQTWTIAPANLAGTIYYWEVNNGNVVRLKPGASAPESFLQKPDGKPCVACHSVSKDGSRIVAAFDGGWSPWVTFDAATGAMLYYSATASGFEAISPNGAYVLWRHWINDAFASAGHLSLSKFDDATEFAVLSPGGGAPAHPAWSGDGGKIAFSVRTDGNGLDFNTSTLWITDVDVGGPSFSNTKQIVLNDPQRPTVTFPTFSPDSKWIAFERSTQARSRGAFSQISLTNLDGSVILPLDATNGVGQLAGDDQLNSSYEPTFNPVSAGGYFWLVVVSERKYGNVLTDADPATRHKQLWVSAIDASPVGGKDPSHPAFWLPGQDTGNQNMRGEWALSPCKKLGEQCDAGYECCDGFCHADDAGKAVCSNQPSGCSALGEACKAAADCCDPKALCTGGFCAEPSPK